MELEIRCVVNWPALFVETVFKSSFSFTAVPIREVVVLYHLSDVFRVTVDVMGDRSGFTCSGMCMKFVGLICVCK